MSEPSAAGLAPQPFSSADLAVAAADARVVDGLAKLEPDPALRLARLAQTSGLPAIGHGRLMALAPDFEAISFELALRRECVALRDEDGKLLVVVADPFDADLLDGLGARLAEPYALVLADHDDLTACLARHEDEVRRAAGLIESREADTAGVGVEDLSLKRISADASPRPTEPDALRRAQAGRSDIHHESCPRLVISTAGRRVVALARCSADLAEQANLAHQGEAELDIAERVCRKDGRFKVRAAARIDFRVSISRASTARRGAADPRQDHLSREMSGSRSDAGFDDAVPRRSAACSEPYGSCS